MVTTFLYDDPEHPDRQTGSTTTAAYTSSDQLLLMALDMWERQQQTHGRGTCACGWPIEIAWHSEMNGWLETKDYLCEVCTVRKGEEVWHTIVRDTRPPGHPELPPFEFGKTTTERD
ncbi:hypothetical protein [Nocardioides sp. T2.26MG-1]|uniref:hypothetical protein n=1 Tax=Nocardioides sp. T2.26MG-1 TaxID=3041166 RepID=UPI0025424360|nr:hypothetical protein [Nocardioides sp. T2.26MG-1]